MTGNEANNNDLAYADTLWKSADALRGQVDAAEYKHVVLGLLFLKYISDSFEARREALEGELRDDGITGQQLESLLENRDEYTAERVFWVPPEARWQNLQNQATRPDVATLIDDAILAVERDNAVLKGKLPRDYARRGIAPEKLKGLIDLIADIGFKGDRARARDTLGRVYEYFLGKFAAGRGQAGRRVLHAALHRQTAGRDARALRGPGLRPLLRLGAACSCSPSASSRPTAARRPTSRSSARSPTRLPGGLAHMNLAIRGIEANLGSQPADTFLRNLHPDLKADYILANPPFNVSDWSGKLLRMTCAGATAHRRSATPTTPGSSTSSTTSPAQWHGGGVAGSSWPTARCPPVRAARARSASALVEDDLIDASSRCPPSSSSPPASPRASGS
jgi:type I restriction enzyme M protein